ESDLMSCSDIRKLQDEWEQRIITGANGTLVTEDELRGEAKSYFAEVRDKSDLGVYKATIGGQVSIAITYSTDGQTKAASGEEILGEVAVFSSAGKRITDGYWSDSPQIYWRTCEKLQ